MKRDAFWESGWRPWRSIVKAWKLHTLLHVAWSKWQVEFHQRQHQESRWYLCALSNQTPSLLERTWPLQPWPRPNYSASRNRPPPFPIVGPTIEEVKHMNGKTPRLDHVAAEAIKTGGDILISQLHGLIRLIWRTEEKVKATAASARTTVKLASVPSLVRSQWKSSSCACKNIVSSKAKNSKPVFDLGGIAAIRFSFFANWSTKEFNVDRGQGLCESTANRRWS